MVMVEVVPVEELVSVSDCVIEAVESGREVGPVLVGLELGLGVGVVVADPGAAMATGDPEIGVQLSDRFCCLLGTTSRRGWLTGWG